MTVVSKKCSKSFPMENVRDKTEKEEIIVYITSKT